MQITCTDAGRTRSAYIPLYQSDLARLNAKSREAVVNYLCNISMTKKQRDLIHFLKSKDTANLRAKIQKLDLIESVVGFLQKYKIQRDFQD